MTYSPSSFATLFYNGRMALQDDAPKNPLVLTVAALANSHIQNYPELVLPQLVTAEVLTDTLSHAVNHLYQKILHGEIITAPPHLQKVESCYEHAYYKCYERMFKMLSERFLLEENDEKAATLLMHFPQDLKDQLLEFLDAENKHLIIARYFRAFTVEDPHKRYQFAEKTMNKSSATWKYIGNFDLNHRDKSTLFFDKFKCLYLAEHPTFSMKYLGIKDPTFYLEAAEKFPKNNVTCSDLIAVMDELKIPRDQDFILKLATQFATKEPMLFMKNKPLIPLDQEVLLPLEIKTLMRLGFELSLPFLLQKGELMYPETVVLDIFKKSRGSSVFSDTPFDFQLLRRFSKFDGLVHKMSLIAIDTTLFYLKTKNVFKADHIHIHALQTAQFFLLCDPFPQERWEELKALAPMIPEAVWDDLDYFRQLEDCKVINSAFELTSDLHYFGVPKGYIPPLFVRRAVLLKLASRTNMDYRTYIKGLFRFAEGACLAQHEAQIVLGLSKIAFKANGPMIELNEFLTALQAECLHIPKESWDLLFMWANLEGLDVNERALTLGARLITDSFRKDYPSFCFTHLIPTLARNRNERLFYRFMQEIDYTMPRTFNLLAPFVRKNNKSAYLNYLMIPMMLLTLTRYNGKTDDALLEQIKVRLIALRLSLKNRDTGLAQALSFTAICLIRTGISDKPKKLRHILQALLLDSIDSIKGALYSLQFLERLKALPEFKEEWTLEELKQATKDTWSTKFGFDTTLIDGFTDKFHLAFGDARMQGNFELYASVQEEPILTILREFVFSVLDGSFNRRRFDRTSSPHLEKLAAFPEIYAKWQEFDPMTPLLLGAEQEEVTSETVRLLFENAALHGHMGPLKVPSSLEACQDDVDRCIFALLDGPPTLDQAIALKEALEIVPSPPELLNDIKGLITKMQPAENLEGLYIQCSYDYRDLFLSGTEVPGSCQRVDGLPQYNKCLPAYLIDGKNQVITVKDATNKIISRMIVRLLFDKNGRPALFLEPLYGRDTQKIRDALMNKARERALYLGVSLYAGQNGHTKLESIGSSAPFEYADSALNHINDGKFTVHGAKLYPTTPLDFDKQTIETILLSNTSIPYTKALHNAAFCMNEKLGADVWGKACRTYIKETGDSFSFNGEVATGTITQPKRLLELLDV